MSTLRTPEQREANKRRLKEWREKRKALGIKTVRPPGYAEESRKRNAKWQKNNPEWGKSYRAKNADQIREKAKKWWEENPEKKRQYNAEWRAKHPEEAAMMQKRWYDAGGAATKSETGIERRVRIKAQVMAHYGGKCAVCAEERLELLTLDHINDDGAAHRKGIGKAGSTATYKWAIDNSFPPIFQPLCHNHNIKKERVRNRGTSSGSAWFTKAKVEALDHYGKTCACCGETDFDMLQLDHIEGGGRKHKKEFNISSVPAWARKNGFPSIFRTLCANCNFSSHIGKGVCYHQR